MNPLAIFGILAGIVAFATALGMLWRAGNGRVTAGSEQVVTLPGVPRSAGATLLQFSTEVCAPCKPTHRLLGEVADERVGVDHIDLDITNSPELASRFNILQTPTTLILDRDGVVRARIGGAPKRSDVHAQLDRILAA